MIKSGEEKHYKKNRLSKRIQRVTLLGNGVSSIFMLIFMGITISALVGFLGTGFTAYTAKEIAKDVQTAYDESMNNKEFETHILDNYDQVEMMDDTSFEEMRDIWVETGEFEKIDDIDVATKLLSNVRFFDYRIEFHGKVIYDSFEVDESMTKLDEMNKTSALNQAFFSGSNQDLYNEDGKTVGKVMVVLSSRIIAMSYLIAISLALIVLLVNQIVNKIVSGFTSRLVSRPLETLADQMVSIANEELEDAFSTKLQVKRPVSEVTSLMNSTDKIMAKMSEYYQTLTAQNQELAAQRDVLGEHRDELEAQTDELEAQRDELEAQRDELEASNEELTVTSGHLHSMNNAYLSRTLKLQNLMDNIGQGFMTFNENLLINSEYSVVSREMVCGDHCNGDIQGRKVTELLFDDIEQRDFIEALFVKIIQGSKHERELFIPLLPEEIHVNNRVQSVEYKIVKDEKFKEQMMLILTDITHQRNLEALMLKERDVLQMIVKVLLNRDDFIDVYEGYKVFAGGLLADRTTDNFNEVLRTLHTFKGSFSQFYLTNITNKLNEEESKLYELNDKTALETIDFNGLNEALQLDMDMIEGYVGKTFVSKNDEFTVKEEKVLEIEHKIQQILPASDYNKILPIIKSIRYKSVKEGLKTYPDYVSKLSERMNKSVAPFEITGDDIFVDFDVYQKVFKSMVHLFRNAVDHGIEDMDTRIEAGKSETAVISCHVQKKDASSFVMTIRDDGRGIDRLKLIDKAISAGRISETEVEAMRAEQQVDLVFQQGITTKEEASVISGRGVGLAATKEMVELLGGHITIETEEGKGTSFVIRLPIIQGAEIISFKPDLLLKRVEGIASNYIKQLGIDLGQAVFEAKDRITLHKVSAVLNVKGSVEGLIILTTNRLCAGALVNAFILDEVKESEVIDYAEDVIGEMTNTIMGNVLETFAEDGVYLNLGVPVMISNENAYIKYSNRQILCVSYEKDGYIMTLNLLLKDKSEDLTGWETEWVKDSNSSKGEM